MSKGLLTILALFAASVAFVWYNAKQTTKSVKQSNAITVGINAEYPPFAFIKNGAITGFDIELVQEIGNRLEKEIVLKNIPFTALIPEVQLGTVSIIASGVSPTEQRARQVLFTDPYLHNDPLVIITPANKNSLTTIDDLKGKRVVVNEGFSSDFYVSQFPEISVTRLDTVDQAFLELDSGRVDAFVTARNPVELFLQTQSNDAFVITAIPDTSDTYALGISKKSPELLEQVQEALDTLKKDGTLDMLKKRWKLA